MIPIEWQPKLFTLIQGGIKKEQIHNDIVSGIIVGIIALPLAIAFAIASGVSPEKGILTAIVAGFIISALGGSRVQIGGPTGAFIVIVSGIIAKYGFSGLITATFMAGIILILMGLLRMGVLLKYIPQTLITGFTSGIAVIIFTTQIKDFLGLTTPDIPENFIARWYFYLSHLPEANIWAVIVALLSIGLVAGIPHISKRIPPAFAALVLTTVITKAFNLPVETIYSKFGNLTFTVPRPEWISIDIITCKALLAPAVTIALLGSLESLLSAVVADSMIGGKHRSNTELIAQGLANMASALLGGIPATGAIARTAANIKNGGRTPLSGMVHAVTLLIIYAVAMPVVRFIPMPALSGILIIVAWNMSEFKEFTTTMKINIYETLVLLTTFILTLVSDLTIALPVGFVLSMILFMKRMSDSIELNPMLTTRASDGRLFSQEVGTYADSIIIFEVNGPMFFGSVHHLLTLNKRLNDEQSILILRFRYVPIVDASGLIKLKSVIKDLESHRIQVVFSGVNSILKNKFLKMNLLEEERILADISDAVMYAENLIKREISV